MTGNELQEQCEVGQRQLMETQYLAAISTLESAEEFAWEERDYGTLSRLYMPLQEARRQARQRCGEGLVNLRMSAEDAGNVIGPEKVLDDVSHGQLLVAGWGSLEAAVGVRKRARERGLYVETFLGAVFPIIGGARAIVVVPREGIKLPTVEPRGIDALMKLLPAHCLVFGEEELPAGSRRGDSGTFARVSAMWEDLHRPFLAAADMQVDPIRKMEGYREAIQVDSACELAHQNLAAVAKKLATMI